MSIETTFGGPAVRAGGRVRRLRVGNALILAGAATPCLAAALVSDATVRELNGGSSVRFVVAILAAAIASILLGMALSGPTLRASPGLRSWPTLFPPLLGSVAAVMYALILARLWLQ